MMLFGIASALLISGIISALAGGGASIATAIANKKAQESANQTNIELQQQANVANAAEAQKTRDWQTVMSNTAHQREMADLEAAGINPLMTAVGSGSSTPSGATATNTSAHVQAPQLDASGITNALQSFNNTMMTLAILNNKTEIANTNRGAMHSRTILQNESRERVAALNNATRKEIAKSYQNVKSKGGTFNSAKTKANSNDPEWLERSMNKLLKKYGAQ